MTVARQLAEFLTATATADLPPAALDHAAMLIASTIASAACGAGLQSARIIRDLARERGGRPDASLWFDTGARLPIADVAQVNAVMSDAAASDDSDLRNIIHAGTPLTAASLAIAERNGADGEAVLTAMVCGYEAAGRISEAITPGFRNRGFHGCLGAVFAAAVAAGRLLQLDAPRMAQAIALVGDLDRRPRHRGEHQCRARVSRRARGDARGQCRTCRAARIPRRRKRPGNPSWILRGLWRRRWRGGRRDRDERDLGRVGTSSPTWRSSWCPAAIPITHSARRPQTPRGTARSPRRTSRASRYRVPA